MELQNQTAAPAQLLVMPDKDGAETLTVVWKATYSIGRDRCLFADEQCELVAGDEHYGEPDASPIKLQSDFSPYKPGTDVVLLGHAYAPKGKAKEGRVRIAVGPVHASAQIFGDRRFAITLGFVRISGPEPFEKIPLTWDRAFGGQQLGKGGSKVLGADERNPVGTGYVKKKARSHVDGLRLPNIEHPKKRLTRPGQRPPAVGFGYVGRHWLPRRNYLGTYDAAWERDRLPLLPSDFDERAFMGAPEALQAIPHLQGNEPVRLDGVTPRGTLRFELPGRRPAFECHWLGSWQPMSPVLDTVVIEPDESRVTLAWRARLRIHNQIRRLRAVRIGVDA